MFVRFDGEGEVNERYFKMKLLEKYCKVVKGVGGFEVENHNYLPLDYKDDVLAICGVCGKKLMR